MAEKIENQRVLELATDIVMTAMETGRLDAGNAEAVANFYYTVATRMCEVSFIDLPMLTAMNLKRREAQARSK